MKISLKSLIFFVTLLGTVYACQKNILSPQIERVDSPILSVEEAKNSFSSRHVGSFSTSATCGGLPNLQITPEWNKSKQHSFAKFSVVETPLLWNNQQLGRLKRADYVSVIPNIPLKNIEMVTSLISVKDTVGNISYKIMVISFDINYLKNNNIKNNNYKIKDPKFTGEVDYYNEDGSFYLGWRFSKGRIIKKMRNLSCSNSSLTERLLEVCTLYEQCTDWYVNGTYDGTSCYYFTECSYYPNDGGYEDPFGYVITGGGDGNTGGSNTDAVIYSPDQGGKDIPSLKSYINCLQNQMSQANSNFKVTIFVEEPRPGSDWYQDDDFGHTFVRFESNGIGQNFGFYLTSGVSAVVSESSGKLKDNGDSPYNSSISFNVTLQQFQNALNVVDSWSGATYNAYSANCTDFGIAVGNSLGIIKLPDPTAKVYGNPTSTPGRFGYAIRNLPASSNYNVSKFSSDQFAPSSKGSCQ
jgi:hypothetical protein